jgi:hypothetical protein
LECGKKQSSAGVITAPGVPARDVDIQPGLQVFKNIEKDVHTIRNAALLWVILLILGGVLAVVLWILR